MAILDSTVVNGSLNANKLYENGKWIIDLIYPVGSIYISVNNVNPQNLFGGGDLGCATWRLLP